MITEAIKNLRPGSAFSVTGETYEGIVWLDTETEMPTREEVEAEAAKIKEEKKRNQYQFQRFLEYPRVEEYLDAVVKNDQEAIQAYIDKCLAVKAKYPKPE
jgi:hypothetical protein